MHGTSPLMSSGVNEQGLAQGEVCREKKTLANEIITQFSHQRL